MLTVFYVASSCASLEDTCVPHMLATVSRVLCVGRRWCSQKVATADAAAYAKSINALFLETSAKTDSNVQDLFLQISALCWAGYLWVLSLGRGGVYGAITLSAPANAAQYGPNPTLVATGKRLPPPGASAAFEDDDPPVDVRRKPSEKGGCC